MKNFIQLSLICILSISAFSNNSIAQVIWQEDFESYVVDSIIDPQSAEWVGWGNTVTSASVSDDFSSSGTQSIKIWEAVVPGSAAALSDILHLFGDSTTGRYTLKFKVFVPSISAGSGAGTYWNIQHEIDASNTGQEWAMAIYIRAVGEQSTIRVGNIDHPFQAIHDQWIDVVHVFDLDRDSADFFYNNQHVVSHPFSYQTNSTTGTNRLSGINLFAECGGTTCINLGYFDDFIFSHFADQQNDAGISNLNVQYFCPGNTSSIEATLRNYGFNNISNATINWSIDGVLQTPINYTGSLAPGEDTTIALANYMFGSNTTDIKIWSSNPNSTTDTVNFNDTLFQTVFPRIQGNLTIDTSMAIGNGNYHTFTALANDLNTFGICGPITVNVAPAIYYEQVTFGNIQGTSAINSIHIDGGDSSATIIVHDGTGTEPVMLLNGTKYMRISNLGFKNTGSSNSVGILLTNQADHNAILNSSIKVDVISTSSANYALVSSGSLTSGSTSGSNASHLRIENNRIIGGYYGIRLNGTSSALDYGNYVYNNILDSVYLTGIYLSDLDSVVIEKNHVNLQSRGGTVADGIWLNECMNFHVLSNYVNVPDYGIYALDANSDFTPRERAQIINNMVISTGDYGIYLVDALDVDVFHNTVSAFGSTQDAFYLTGAISNNLDIRNNIFASQSSPAFDYNEAATTILNLNNNLYHSAGTNLIRFNGTNYIDLAAFQTAFPSLNVNSLQGNPGFIDSTSNLHLIGTLANNSGDNSVGVTLDFDGESRPISGATTVDIGADEYAPPTCLPVLSIDTLNIGVNYVDIGFDGLFSTYEYEYGPKGFMRGGGIDATSLYDSTRILALSPNTEYDLYVRKTCGRGDTAIWNGPFSFSTLNAVPYFNDFEKFGINSTIDIESWHTQTTTSLDWESDFETPSGSTGPEEDHTIGRGGIFLFLEASSGAQYDYADLISTPIYVDSAYDLIELSFWYHKYGSTMGNMEIYIDTNGTLTYIDAINGSTHSSQFDPWLNYSTRLTGFQGKTVRIVFRGYKDSDFYGDMAIDDFSLDFIPLVDAGIASMVDPYGVICPGTTSPIVELVNYGSDTLTSVKIKYSINGVMDSVLFNGSILPSSSQNVTLNSINLTPNTSYDIQIYTDFPNSVADIKPTNDTLSFYGIQTSLPGGVYTVDTAIAVSSSNFHTVNDAINALETYGICGPVTINIAEGIYYEQITFDQAIVGSNLTNTITFDGGDSSKTFISHNNIGTRATVLFDGVQFITLKNLGIINSATTSSVGIQFINEANNNSLYNNSIKVSFSSTSTTNYAIVSSGSLTSATTSGNNASYLTIENNRIIGGYYGIRLNGNPTKLDYGISIRNNILEEIYLTGIYISDVDSIIIEKNHLDLQSRSNAGTDGIWLNESMHFYIYNNYVNVPDYGIHGLDANSDFPSRNRAQIINNMVISTGDYGIYFSDAVDVDIFHNSISVFGTTADAFYATGTSLSNLDIRNNIFVSKNSPAFDYNELPATLQALDNNIYFSGTSVLARIDGNDLADLAALQTATPGFNNNSLQGDPIFVDNSSNLHILLGSLLAHDMGDNSVGVNEDFDGQNRPLSGSTIVDIGADEFAPPALNANVAGMIYPAGAICPGTVTPIVAVANSGTDSIASVNVVYSINGILDSVSFNGIIAPSDTQSVSLNPVTFNSLVNYDIKIYTSMPNGRRDEYVRDDTLSFINLQTGLDGIYTIDASLPASNTNFQSITAAVDALNSFGVCDAVTFNIAPGIYNGALHLNEIGGSSMVNTISFDGADSSLVHILADANNIATILLDGTDHLHLKNLKIENQGNANAAVLFGPGSNYNSIRNSELKVLPSTSSSSITISFTGDITSTTTNGAIANYNIIQNNRMVYGSYGIRIYGATDAPNTYNQIVNNDFDSVYTYGIYSYYQDSLEIIGNTIDAVSRGNSATDGIYSHNSVNTLIKGNNIHANDFGMYVYSFNTPSASKKERKYEIVNNMIISENDNGLYLYYTDSVNILHNSISVRGSSPALQIYTSTSISIEDYDVRNNILDAGSDLALLTNTPATLFDILDYNLYYTTGTDLITIDGTDYTSLFDFQVAYPSFNASSVEGQPSFLSPSDLHVDGFNTNNKGDNSVGVNIDIDGDIRPISPDTTVDIGADEYLIPPIDAAVYSMPEPTFDLRKCFSSAENISIGIANRGLDSLDFTLNNLIVTVDITGAITQTIKDTISNNSLNGGNPIMSNDSVIASVGTVDMTQIGAYYFNITIQLNADGKTSNNVLLDTIVTLTPTGGAIAAKDTVCFGEMASLSTIGSLGEIQWQRLVNGVFVDETGADSTEFEVTIDSTTTFRAVACDTAYSDTITIISKVVPVPSVMGDTVQVLCGNEGTAILTASSTEPQALFNWYESPSSIAPIASNDTLLYKVNTSTQPGAISDTFYVSTGAGTMKIGAPNKGQNSGYTLEAGLFFDVYVPSLTIKGVYVYPLGTGAGTVSIALKDPNGNILDSLTVNMIGTSTGVRTYVPLNFNVANGTGYSLVMLDNTAGVTALVRDFSGSITGSGYPFTIPNIMSITDGRCCPSGTSSAYYYFYDWEISAGCESERVQVIGQIECTLKSDLSLNTLIQPSTADCFTSTEPVEALIVNLAGNKAIDFTVDTFEVIVNVSGAASQSFSVQLNDNSLNGGPLLANDSVIVNLGNLDMTAIGTYNFEAYLSSKVDTFNLNDTIKTSINNNASGGTLSAVDTICGSDFVTLNTTGSQGDVQWQRLVGSSFVNEVNADSVSYEVFLDSTTTFRLIACATEISDTITIISIDLPPAPTTLNDTVSIMCGLSGEAILTAGSSSMGTFNWYDAATAGNLITTGDTLKHSFSSSTQTAATSYADTFYVFETTLGCEGPRSMAIAVINILNPDAPTVQNDTAIVFCGDSGTAVLTASSIITGAGFEWYESATSTVVHSTGDTLLYGLNTATQTATTIYSDTFYVVAIDPVSNCESPRSMVTGTVVCTVGDEEMPSSISGVSIHPNPSKGIFQLIGNNVKEEFTVSIFNTNGKKVFELDTKVSSNFNKQIDLTGLAKGIYFVRLQSKDSMEMKKVVIH